MPATIEELQGVVAGLSEVVKGLVGAIQLQAQTSATHASAADPTPAPPNQNFTTLRLPTLQLPTFRQDTKVQDDIAEFLDRFQEQTSHLPATIRLSLLEQQCIGEWPRSVLSFCRSTEGFSDKSPDEQLASFISRLRDEFQEPTDSKCRRLAAELSAMKQDPSESVDEFAFKYKNTLHQLDKLGESLTKSCPTYVTSQFISKLQPHIAQHLVLQAHHVTQLDKAIEFARRIEHSFITATDKGSASPLPQDSPLLPTASNEGPQRTALLSSSGQFRGDVRPFQQQRSCWICGQTQHTARDCTQRPPAQRKKIPEVCRNFNRLLSANCEQANNKCSAGRLHKCSQCHKWGCKALRHKKSPMQSLVADLPPLNKPADGETSTTSQEPVVFGLPAVTNPAGKLHERHILWTPVTSAGEKLPLPLDSCCSVSLVSRSHADLVASKYPQLKFQSLEKPVAVSVADAKSQLKAVGTMEIPIQWSNGKETTFQMLVVPGLSWPILFGENHLHSTQALVDHATPSIHFRHPSMSFKLACSLQNPLTDNKDHGVNTHAGVTCLLTGPPCPGLPPGNSKLNRGLNFVSVCLTIGTSLMALSHSDLWIDGHEIQPGVKVLSGPFHMTAATDQTIPSKSCHVSACTLPSPPLETIPTEYISDLQPSYTTTLAVECKRKQTDIPLNIILGNLRPICQENTQAYADAAENTATVLADSWMCWANGQSKLSLSPSPTAQITTHISSTQTWKISEQQKELTTAGLDSSILSPFSENISEFHEHEFVPPTSSSPDPSSAEYHQSLIKALALDSPKYAHVDQDTLEDFKHLLRKYPTAFLLPGSSLGEIQGFQHHIDTEDALPVYKHPYRKSPEELLAIKNELQRMLKMKIIQPSKSEWGAPCILVRKPLENGMQQPPRFVVDYRGLNSVTRGDGYPIPSIASVLDSISQGKVFGHCDLASGYWQIPLRPQDRHKSAFCTHVGLYEFLRLPFGLKTAPNTFQRILNTVFADYLHQWLTVYVDDIIMWSQTHRDALHCYELLFARAVKVGVQFKPTKCTFFAKQIQVLGHTITEHGRRPNSKGIEAITSMEPPTSTTSLKRFLGLCNFFRDYIPNMPSRTQHLRQLLKKDTPFAWSPNHTMEFEDLKQAVTGPDVLLHHPDWNSEFELHVDASKLGCGAMLAQWKDHQLRPVRFASRAFTPAESRWHTLQQELFAVKWGLEHFRPYILGRRIKVITDHANLKWLTSLAPQQAKLARWCMSMAEFDFYIEHRPGITNTVPDTLSRQPIADLPLAEEPYAPEDSVTSFILLVMSMDIPHHTPSLVSETLNGTVAYVRHVCLLTPITDPPAALKRVEPDTSKEAPIKPSSDEYLPVLAGLNLRRSQFAEQQQLDYWCHLVFKFLSSGGDKSHFPAVPQKHLQWARHFSKRAAVIDGILMYRDELMDNPNHYRFVVPDDIQLRRHLLRAYHDSPIAMHRGREATYQALANDFYWRNMSKHVRNWIRRCPDCIRFKTIDQHHGPMQVRLYEHPFHTLGIDYVGELPVSPNGNKWILTAVCPYSNFLRAIPVPDKRATTAACALYDHVFLEFGFPAILQSDQGGEWTNAILQELTKLLSIEHVFTTSYRPRLNGSTERVHRWLNSALGIYCEKNQQLWEEFLQPATYAHNTSPIPGTDHVTPFFLVFGRHAPSPEVLGFEMPPAPLSQASFAKELIKRSTEARKTFDRIKADLKRTQREYYDMHSRDLHVPDGKRVFVRLPPPSSTVKGAATRFLRRYDGPFLVVGHVHGREDLLRIRHIATGKELRAVNIEKIVVVPDGDPLADIRPDTEPEKPLQTATPSLQERTVVPSPRITLSSDLAKVALAFGQYLDSLSKPQCYASEASKAVYRNLPEAKDILNRHGKLKGLVTKCPYLSLKGGPHGGTYLLVLDVKLFHELNK